MHVIGNLRLGGGQKITYAAVRGLPRPEFQASVCCLEEGGHYGDLLRAEGIPVFALGRRKNYGARGLLHAGSLLRDMVALLRKETPDIVHTHLFGAGLVGRLAARLAGVPTSVTTLHRIFYPVIQPMTEKLLSLITARVIVDSQAVGQLVRRRCRINPDKIQVIYNGIDPQELSSSVAKGDARQQLGLPATFCVPDAKLIGVIAHLLPHKGQRHLIEALPHIRARGISARVVLVGDGPDKPALQKRTAELNLQEFVYFAGYRSDMNTALSALDLLALPSSWEGFGLILAEGMYKRLPAISTDVGGSAEVIADSETGYLVPFGNVGRLADAASAILANDALAKNMGAAGRRRVEAMFTLDRMVDAYASTYRSLCDRPVLPP